jgi:hypothetical protein
VALVALRLFHENNVLEMVVVKYREKKKIFVGKMKGQEKYHELKNKFIFVIAMFLIKFSNDEKIFA